MNIKNYELDKVTGKFRRIFFGMKFTDGLIFSILVYGLLISMGFVFVFPIFNMLSSSFKNLQDLLDPTVGFIPSSLYFDNYQKAFQVLNFKKVFFESIYVTVLPALLQTVACAIIGYGFARYNFVLKNLWFVLTLVTFIIPPQVTMIPKYLMFKSFGLLGNVLSVALPALFGQGLRSAIFILIFYQFFKMMPKALEEAAKIDGATDRMIFFKVAIPTAVPSIIVTFIFSLVWYWNETYTLSLYLAGKLSTLPIELLKFSATFLRMFPTTGEDVQRINEGIRMAGTILTILPVLLIYFGLQKWFVEGVDKSGITGE